MPTPEEISRLQATNKKTIYLPIEIDIDYGASELLLHSIQPVMEKIARVIQPILIEEIISIRQKLLSNEELVTINRAAYLCGVDRKTIYIWIKSGKVSHIQVGKHKIVSVRQVKAIKQQSKLAGIKHKDNWYYRRGKKSNNTENV